MKSTKMIYVTRLNHTSVVLNSDLIEQIETTPDTVISLTTGQKIMVLESTEQLLERVVNFRRSIVVWPHESGASLSSLLPGEPHGRT